MRELVLRKCKSCGALVKVFEDCNCKCGLECCGEKMEKITPNSVDAAVEKHIPTYEIKDDVIEVVVNHVMEEDHYIEWIAAVSDNYEEIKYLQPGVKAKATFKYHNGMTLYSYCNKHSLWKKEVE